MMETKKELQRKAWRFIGFSILSVAVGFVLMFGLAAAMGKGGAGIGVIAYGLGALGSVICWVISMSALAKSKGYPPSLGLLGILGLLGAIVLLVIPDQGYEEPSWSGSPAGPGFPSASAAGMMSGAVTPTMGTATVANSPVARKNRW
jgi:hypothetical protein